MTTIISVTDDRQRDSKEDIGRQLHLKHLSPDCRQLLRNAEKIIDVNIIEDPTYHLVVDKLG